MAFIKHSIILENGDSEGTPISDLETQAAALPVISTYHAGVPDVVIINNETGLLVEEHDVDGMAKSMLHILKVEGLVQKLGKAGTEKVVKNFTMEKHLGTLQKLIRQIIIKGYFVFYDQY